MTVLQTNRQKNQFSTERTEDKDHTCERSQPQNMFNFSLAFTDQILEQWKKLIEVPLTNLHIPIS